MSENKEPIQLSLYDLNKQLISQLPVFDDDKWDESKKILSDWVNITPSVYHMLYGKEVGYFTVFTPGGGSNYSDFYCAVKDCLDNLGDVKSFDVTEDKTAIEIWVEIPINEEETEHTCLYLFPYDMGIVTYGR